MREPAGGPGGRYRANPELIVSFPAAGRVRLSVPRTRRTLTADAAVLQVLAAVCDGSGRLFSLLRERYSEQSLDRAVRQLADAQVLVEDPHDDGLPAAWHDWGEAAWFPHLMTRDLPYQDPYESQADARARIAAGDHPPSPYKCLCGRALATRGLPEPTLLSGGSLAQTLLRRRTSRYFTGEPCSAQQVADLLFYTGGALFEQELDGFGHVIKKCSPSGGSRHPTEIYAVIGRGGELPAGVYHYCTKDHALALIQDPLAFDIPAFLDEAMAGQEWFACAPAVFFLTCVRGRLAWKYTSPRTYRIAHLESGHYGQTFVLTATCLGLGAFQVAAFADSVIEKALGIDGASEFVMYAMGAGHPLPGVRYPAETCRVSQHLPEGAAVTIA